MDSDTLIRTLGAKLGLAEAAFDAKGEFAIAIGDDAALYATRIDEHALEWSLPLSDLDFADQHIARVMLEANCLGVATGAGRLAMDGDERAFFSERWIVRGLDEAEAERRFEELGTTAMYWLSEGVDLLLKQAEMRSAPSEEVPALEDDGDDRIMLRL